MNAKHIFQAVTIAEHLADRLNAAAEKYSGTYFSIKLGNAEDRRDVLKTLLTADVRLHPASHWRQVGVGIDFDTMRKIENSSLSSFLSADEVRWIKQTSRAYRTFHIMRLWTIKRALRKAIHSTPALQSDSGDKYLVKSSSESEYVVQNPAELAGKATDPAQPGLHFLYATSELDRGLISIAVAIRAP
jgi:hypothetical protein